MDPDEEQYRVWFELLTTAQRREVVRKGGVVPPWMIADALAAGSDDDEDVGEADEHSDAATREQV